MNYSLNDATATTDCEPCCSQVWNCSLQTIAKCSVNLVSCSRSCLLHDLDALWPVGPVFKTIISCSLRTETRFCFNFRDKMRGSSGLWIGQFTIAAQSQAANSMHVHPIFKQMWFDLCIWDSMAGPKYLMNIYRSMLHLSEKHPCLHGEPEHWYISR